MLNQNSKVSISLESITQINFLHSHSKKLMNEIRLYQQRIVLLETTIQHQRLEIKKLTNENSVLVPQLKQEIKSLRASKRDLLAENQYLRAAYHDLNTQNEQKKAFITSITATLNGLIFAHTCLQKKINFLSEQINFRDRRPALSFAPNSSLKNPDLSSGSTVKPA